MKKIPNDAEREKAEGLTTLQRVERLLEIVEQGVVDLERHNGEIHVRRNVMASIKNRTILLLEHLRREQAAEGPQQ